jgi:hypothetical protein
MGIVVEAVKDLLHVFVHDGVMRDAMDPIVVLRFGRELPVHQQVRHLHVVALLCQLLDGIAPIAEDPALPIDEGDGALA